MNAESHLRNGFYPSIALIRRIWAELTRNPRVSYCELGGIFGCHCSHARYAVAALIAAGYVEHEPGAKRARRIIVPFYLLEKEANVES